jgi:flavin reductase (DIM6/NTAB) family NADH-FMN oxidoreductase RutF
MGKFDSLEKTGAALAAIGNNSALLVTGTHRPNVMTIGWAMASVMWGKSLFVAPVRQSRYSHELLETHGEFTVLVPSGDMKKAVALCGSKSGRDTDKVAAAGLMLAPSSAVSVPHIEAPGLVLECRVIYKTDFADEALDDAVRAQWYSGRDTGNLHTLYFGEILAQYEQS